MHKSSWNEDWGFVDLEGGTAEIGKDIAMHIAAMKPRR